MVSPPQPTAPQPKVPREPPGSRNPRPVRPGAGRRRAGRALRSLEAKLTRQFITRNRRLAFALSLVTIAIAVAAVHVSEWWFSPGVIILPILAGGLLLWPRALRIYFVFAAGALSYDVVDSRAGAGIVATIVLTAIFADVLARTREKLGVQGLRGDRMLLELRDRIRAQGKLPELGEGWASSLVLKPAGGSSFGGDFVVSFCDGKILEVALVDVSGKGIDAGTRALLLSGAFGGLLGSVPRDEFLPACNAYMRRGSATEGFVTAVHLSLDLASGEYVISSAGHPPAAHYDASGGRWRLTRAHGIVLGVVADLHGAATEAERGVLQRGDALMLYTDGLVESPGRDIDAGTDRLLGEAERLLSSGFSTGAPALVAAMQREIGGSDDCALVLIWRT
ncbi:MAG: PP2C family protein-serine/threonine phosphatase [Streptosporangiaceae bacterium]